MILNILAKCFPITCVCQNYFFSNTTASVESSYFAYLGQFASYSKFLGGHIQQNGHAHYISSLNFTKTNEVKMQQNINRIFSQYVPLLHVYNCLLTACNFTHIFST